MEPGTSLEAETWELKTERQFDCLCLIIGLPRGIAWKPKMRKQLYLLVDIFVPSSHFYTFSSQARLCRVIRIVHCTTRTVG